MAVLKKGWLQQGGMMWGWVWQLGTTPTFEDLVFQKGF
jgi:hypothetical protein